MVLCVDRTCDYGVGLSTPLCRLRYVPSHITEQVDSNMVDGVTLETKI